MTITPSLSNFMNQVHFSWVTPGVLKLFCKLESAARFFLMRTSFIYVARIWDNSEK